MDRLGNLVGAYSLAIADRVAPDVPGRRLAGSSTAAALVTLLAHPGRSVGWLAEVLGLTSSGTTRLLDRLIAVGLVRHGQSNDIRYRSLHLTDVGRRHAEQALRHRESEIQRSLVGLTQAERQTLEGLLAKLVEGLAGDQASGWRVCRLCDRKACLGPPGRCPLDHRVDHGAPTRA